ncbi:MAG: hypothetical protein ACR2RB_01370 [Gammaproteobacteria bacterium]
MPSRFYIGGSSAAIPTINKLLIFLPTDFGATAPHIGQLHAALLPHAPAIAVISAMCAAQRLVRRVDFWLYLYEFVKVFVRALVKGWRRRPTALVIPAKPVLDSDRGAGIRLLALY